VIFNQALSMESLAHEVQQLWVRWVASPAGA